MTDPQPRLAEAHYEGLLGPRYTWSMGGAAACESNAKALLDAAGVTARPRSVAQSAKALDLGAGAGFHARALAERGFEVIAVDTSSALMQELSEVCAGFGVTPIHGNLLNTAAYRAHGPFELILCVGDTLTHLSTQKDVGRLIESAAALLAPGGTLVLQYREQEQALPPQDSSFVLRADRDRIMECVVHYDSDLVWVTDIVHEWTGQMWRTMRSTYPKLRISLDVIVARVIDAGLSVKISETMGRQRLLVLKPA